MQATTHPAEAKQQWLTVEELKRDVLYEDGSGVVVMRVGDSPQRDGPIVFLTGSQRGEAFADRNISPLCRFRVFDGELRLKND